VTTFVRAPEAARRLGVSTATLYSYVSRRKVRRTLAADGRSSLFDIAELDLLIERNRRPTPPPPTIDVRVSTAVTQLSDEGLRFRDIPVEQLVDRSFEDVAELLWSGTLPDTATAWPEHDITPSDSVSVESSVMGLIRLATTITPTGNAPEDARQFLTSIPGALGTRRARNDAPMRYAQRLTMAWTSEPSNALVQAVNTALVLLADHELATSTLAVRVAASVRSSPLAAMIAGLAAVEGQLHGSAGSFAHKLLEQVAKSGPVTVLGNYRSTHTRVPGFGHKIYRHRDPRVDLLLDRVHRLPDPHGRLRTVQGLLATSGALVTQHPNIDLAVGALTFVSGLPPDTPIFAIARVAGWTAHYLEEIEERPVRFRGLAR
jgi:citrate synthase